MGISLSNRGMGLSRAGGPPPPDVDGPVVTSVSYDTVTDILTLTVDEDCTLFAMHNASATPLSAATIEAGNELLAGGQPLTDGLGYVDWDDAGWGAGTWYLHLMVKDGSGNTTVLTPIEHIIGSVGPYASVFDGVNDYLHTTGLSAPAGNTQGALVLTFRVPTTWPASGYLVAFRNAGGSGLRTQLEFVRDSSGGPPTTQGRLFVTLRNSGGSGIGSLTFANGTFLVDTWYTILISWDTVTQTWVTRKRVGGGSWVTPTYTGVPSLTLNGVVASTPEAIIGASTSAGASQPGSAWEVSEIWYGPSQLPDFTNSTVQAAFEPLANKGSTGDVPTGTAPLIYLANETATFHVNKVTGSAMTVAGALAVAGTTPT